MELFFLYPSHVLGGCELLFARISCQLAQLGYDITIIDFADGTITSQIHSSEVKFIQVERFELTVIESGILICPASLIIEIFNWIDVSSKVSILFWCVHPYNTVFIPPIFQDFFIARPKLLKFVTSLLFRNEVNVRSKALRFMMSRQAMLYMDTTTINETTTWHDIRNVNSELLPIPLDSRCENTFVQRNFHYTTFNLFWIGRLVDFKVHVLIYLITAISESRFKNRIRLHIIGDGDQKSKVVAAIQERAMDVIYYDVLTPTNLEKTLLKHADIVFAMGTSALEGARLGIPTILVDSFYYPVKFNYKFRWIFQSSDYVLGKLNPSPNESQNDLSLDELLVELIADPEIISKNCFDYFQQNHSLSSVVEKLLSYANSANMTMSEYASNINYRPSALKKIWYRIKHESNVSFWY